MTQEVSGGLQLNNEEWGTRKGFLSIFPFDMAQGVKANRTVYMKRISVPIICLGFNLTTLALW
jgi:hypothetical protein